MNTHPFAFIVPVIVFVISIAHFVISGERPYGRDKPYANRTKIFQEFQQEMPKLTKGLGEPTRIFHAHKQGADFVGISHSYPKSETLTQLVHTNAIEHNWQITTSSDATTTLYCRNQQELRIEPSSLHPNDVVISLYFYTNPKDRSCP